VIFAEVKQPFAEDCPMKTILKTLMRAIARALASESGELLSTRRKSHLLYGDMYARMGSQNETESRHTVELLDASESGGLLATRRQAHLQQNDIYARLGREAETELRHLPAKVARRSHRHLTPAAG